MAIFRHRSSSFCAVQLVQCEGDCTYRR